MEEKGFLSVVKTFYYGVLCVFLLFAMTLLSSFVESRSAGTLPDAAYGLDASVWDFTVPENPILSLWVWEYDDVMRRDYVMLDARTPIKSGPRVSWDGAKWHGTDWNIAETNPGADGLTITAESGGLITMSWEHEEPDCGHTHSWWYGAPFDGALLYPTATRSYDKMANGAGQLCVLWRGEGGTPIDTLNPDGSLAPATRHDVRTLVDEMGFAGANVTQDSMSILVYVESRTLLGRLEAKATLRVTMTSQWYGAGACYNAECLAHAPDDTTWESDWIEYAAAAPAWTVELISYREADENMY